MKYLSEIQLSSKTLGVAGYINTGPKRLNSLKHADVPYVMTGDVFNQYAWLVGMTQYKRFVTKLNFSAYDPRVLEPYRLFVPRADTQLQQSFRLSMARFLFEDPLDEAMAKKEQAQLRQFLKNNQALIFVYEDGLHNHTRIVSYVLKGKDGQLYTFNGHKGLLAMIKDRVI